MASPLTPQDKDDIRAFYGPWTECILADDTDGLLEFYTDDAVLMPPNAPALRGREAVREFMDGFPRITRAEFEVEEIDGYEDLAYVTGRYSMTLEPDGAPEPIDDRGKFIEIRRRGADGVWRLSRDIFNSDLEA